jgi:outer membrane protein assembly factor BamB
MNSWRKTVLLITLALGLSGFLTGCHKTGTTGTTPSARWKLNIGRGRTPLALGPDGTIYALLDSGNLVAVDPGGKTKWSREAALGNKLKIGPAVTTDGAIYVVGYNKIVAFNSEGNTRLEFPIGTSAASFAITVTDDTLYAQCMRVGTCAFNRSTGTDLMWHISQDTANSIVEPDGTVVFGNDCVVAIRDGAQAKWIFPASRSLVPDEEHDRWFDIPPGPGLEVQGLSAGSDGATYVNRSNGLTALDSTGQLKWQFEAPLFRGHQPLVATDGTVYLASQDRHLYALRPDGSALWKLETSGTVAQPLLGSAGTIFFVDGHSLRAVTRDGRAKWSTDLDSEVFNYGYATGSATTLSDDGTLYVASQAGTLYAFPVGETLMNSAWPKFQANARNSGQVNQ